MNKYETLFLQALKASLQNEKVNWEEALTAQEWAIVFRLAEKHNVLPMIYEAVYGCPAAKAVDAQEFLTAKRRTIHNVALQTKKTSEFLQLYQHLKSKGITPVVVKGIVCRSLYPNPDYRLSTDEDLWVSSRQFADCHEAMLEYGMVLKDSEKDIADADEVSYYKEEHPLYIELHRELFPPDSEAYGELNDIFENCRKDAVEVSIDGENILTMNATDHLFYLICHAFKHFMHSGFGIRQVCDILMFANAFGEKVNWEWIFAECCRIRAEVFAAALFQIGERYLIFDPKKAHYPDSLHKIVVEEGPLLEDLLCGGIYGSSDIDRVHSSLITLNAVADDKQGKEAKVHILKSLFPGVKSLEGRYPYLESRPYLLPVAWTDRIIRYGKEMSAEGSFGAVDSIRIGERRVELLKKYNIID